MKTVTSHHSPLPLLPFPLPSFSGFTESFLELDCDSLSHSWNSTVLLSIPLSPLPLLPFPLPSFSGFTESFLELDCVTLDPSPSPLPLHPFPLPSFSGFTESFLELDCVTLDPSPSPLPLHPFPLPSFSGFTESFLELDCVTLDPSLSSPSSLRVLRPSSNFINPASSNRRRARRICSVRLYFIISISFLSLLNVCGPSLLSAFLPLSIDDVSASSSPLPLNPSHSPSTMSAPPAHISLSIPPTLLLPRAAREVRARSSPLSILSFPLLLHTHSPRDPHTNTPQLFSLFANTSTSPARSLPSFLPPLRNCPARTTIDITRWTKFYFLEMTGTAVMPVRLC
ncbi:hypothetical protein BLNAU_21136 [Blattamonas nauphoetae]|uniref:Uncharacterized protein n=1 Tax=Blattamonas nauphoetae TaxID=2049346 RepID=A0ABQ9WX89_9EUKA|nr:hypothetical protein BLNAU_21136 [Blattamonas nauphoetae]